ncbi:matrix-remodeling-associated protein 7-like isoform X4 [Dunckerocampus dactyliophorus]|uniref:matrix-remodeling-associated protein 7-like isoform X4 n=1 Tax=Dunckerocampus dactyliophorus TaxID=161453 RepID=UPI00240518A7|nr:matrix-remodeling-associated protein 7-like isoform X4 [Dunckerocampus dactyliophorus]
MDPTFILSAVIFTLLALVVATSLLNGSQDPLNGRSYPVPGEPAAKQNGHVPDTKQSKKKAVDDWCELSGSSHDHWDVVKSVQSTEGAAESPEVIDKTDCNTNNSFQYVPGKSRSHHMEMMMSKEELEEEQRVQREQLAAIFQLLRDNTETFGEVSEGDMEEQLRLYSI